MAMARTPRFSQVLAGNHDHYGNVTAQIAYSNLRSNWHYPSLYYTWTEQMSGFSVQFVQLDTVTLAGQSVTKDGEELQGTDPRMAPADQAAADAQYAWLNQTLAASTADFLFVSGHFPVWSVCEHGGLARIQIDPLFG